MKELDVTGAVDLSELGIKRTETEIDADFFARKEHMNPEQYYLMLCDTAIASGIIDLKFYRGFTTMMSQKRKLPIKQVIGMMEQVIMRKIAKIRNENWHTEGNIISNADRTLDGALHGSHKKKG